MLVRRLATFSLLPLLACQGSSTHSSQVPGPKATVSAIPLVGPRRGPVLLRFTLDDPSSEITAVHLQRKAGSGFVPATTRSVERLGNGVLAVWDSFADVNTDTDVSLQLAADTAKGEVDAPVAVSIRNNPETDRLILVGQNMGDLPDGGATDTGTGLSILDWSGSQKTVMGDPVRITVGQGPSDLRAAPHGRATAIVESHNGTLSVVATPLDAAAGGVKVLASLKFPEGFAVDAHWSPDGRYLYVMTNGSSPTPSQILRLEPAEDLSSFPMEQSLIQLPGPPSRFAVDPVSGNLLVACGPGAHGQAQLVLYAPDGHQLANLIEDLDSANALVIHPQGGMAIWTGDFSADQVRRFRFDNSSLTEVMPVISTVPSPQEVVFHPASTTSMGAALIANSFHDRVTPLVLTSTDATVGMPAGKVPLASELDLIERGTQTGTVFATAVSEVYRVTLTADGQATNEGSIHDFGMATEDILKGIAVQR